MFAVKLLANSALASNCYIVLNMPSVFTFHISDIPWDIIVDHSWNLLISNYTMFMFKTNEPIKVIHLQKFANQSMLHGAFEIKIASNSFSESKKIFGRLIKLGTFWLKK